MISTCRVPLIASKALVRKLVKICRSWCGSPWIGRSASGTSTRTSTSPLSEWLSAIAIASRMTSATAMSSTCSRIGRTKASTSCTITLAIFASLMMSARTVCASGESVQLALEQPGHHLDAGQRVLDFVRDRRGHLAERGQPIAQPLALLELLDARQVLEEERRADVAPARVLDERQRVADHLAGVLQPQLGAVGQVRQLERAGDDAERRRARP